MINRWHGNFKKGHLSAEPAFKSDRSESAMNNQNVKVWAILKENL